VPAKRAFVPAMVGAGICLFLLKSGFFAFFFLVPLGFIALRYDYKTAWIAFSAAVFGFAAINIATRGVRFQETSWDLVYFGVVTFIFTFINAPPPSLKASGMVRLLGCSCLGALLLSAILLKLASSPGFPEYINYMMKALLSAYRSSGSDVVQMARLEAMTPERIISSTKYLMFRGGSLLFCIFIFFVSRQVSLVLVRLFQRRKGMNSAGINSGEINSEGINSLVVFHVEPVIIWVFSASLLLIVLTRITKLEIPEIILWNVLFICVILYLAQGLGILQFFLARLSPFVRFILGVLLVVMLFSPFLNVLLLGALVILGIAENWAPLRVAKKNGPPSTPEAGDSEG
jgi:hypothetical protein